ncbi:ABC transporter permease subunit [Nocardiopsis changdeensis]|uniref:ABC transporter permease n=1 Tax=Nocardiopsis changdeensis TaxID=2831969 RepID=A0ABX8BJV5_9ACTN|nr:MULTISPECIES: ABC transporter permease [Nocardiopsis]QUX22015.1 ABC transporter permease [Nocardiopsis changdeensis]QYX37953.1 ABC transporter permease [Nocardiopsis sp. MT53]
MSPLRPDPRHPLSLGLLCGAGALLFTVLAAAAAGSPPGTTLNALWTSTAGNPFALGAAVNTAAAILLVACGFVIAFRANLVNVGGEGQFALGAVGATAVGVHLPESAPALLALPLVLGAAALGGAAWAAVAAGLLVRRGVNEIITTLLLNFIGLALLMLAVHDERLLRQPVTSAETLPQSEPLVEAARVPLLGLPGSPMTAAAVLALLGAAGTAFLLHRTATGLRLTAVGRGAAASRRLGVSVGRVRFGSLTAAGAFAGLAGGTVVASAPYVLADGIAAGYGFTGLVAGLLARGSMTALVLITLALGLLAAGGIGVQLAAGVPAAISQMTEAVLVLLVAGTALLVRTRPRARRAAGPPPAGPVPSAAPPEKETAR